MKLNFIFFVVVITLVSSNVEGNCPSEEPQEKIYSCKAKDEEGQDLSCICNKMPKIGKFNCSCFAHNLPTPGGPYLDCLDALRKGQNESGVYSLKPDNLSPFKAYCDMDTDGGGWTVFQRRMDGSVEFYLNWVNYVHGFGNTSREYWLGLSKIHRLANGSVPTQLRVDMRNKDGNNGYASYSTFYIGGSTTDYTLHVSGYSGTAGDALANHNLMKFTTKDNDNDQHSDGNCAHMNTGAWWYAACHTANLNGRYNGEIYYGVTWYPWKNRHESLPFAEMKVRRV